jgi:hypothetical protein
VVGLRGPQLRAELDDRVVHVRPQLLLGLRQLRLRLRDLLLHSRNIQGTFREHSGNIQGTFREHLGNIQGTFREHSGNI